MEGGQPKLDQPPGTAVTANPVYDRLVTGFYNKRVSRCPAYRPEGGSDWLLMLTQEGSGRLGLPDGSFRRSHPMDITLYHPRTPQLYGRAPEAEYWTIVWVHFHPHPHWLAWLAWPEAAPGLGWLTLDDSAFEKTRGELLAMNRIITESPHPDRDLAMNHLERALLFVRTAEEKPSVVGESMDIRLEKVLAWIHRRLSGRIRMDEMAAAAGLSVSGLAHLFTHAMGVAPMRYVDMRRLERAADLLRCTPLSVKEIAAELGFEDPFYFSRRFRRSYGDSPAVWRKKIAD